MRLRVSRVCLTAVAVVVALTLAACQPSTDETATTAASTTVPSAPTTSAPSGEPQGPSLVPFTDYPYGMRTLVPEGWAEVTEGEMAGILLPPDAEVRDTGLAIDFVNGTSSDALITVLATMLESNPFESVGSTASDRLIWELFRSTTEAEAFGGGVTGVDLALSEADGGVYVVLLLVPEADSDLMRTTVFMPAVEALTPEERPPVEPTAPYLNPSLPVEERIEDLLSRMTLLEKIGQMTLVEKDSVLAEDVTTMGLGGLLSGGGGSPETNTPEAWADMVDGFQERAAVTRLGIPLLYGVDAIHGHNNVRGAVIFPHNLGLGAAGDSELVARIGRATAIETAATGIFWNYAPVVAVPQDIRWGRTYEAYGQETDLVAVLATAFIGGLQGKDLEEAWSVLATPKHFVGDGATAWGSSQHEGYAIDQGVARIDEATLRAVHLPPYQMAIDAGVLSVMASFSSWDGLKMHAQRYLLTDVLKAELGFGGFVVSDWAGVDQISDDYYEATITAVNAGIDINMVPSRYHEFVWTLARAVDAGRVPMDRIDDAVRRILRAKFALGLFEGPFAERSLLPRVGSSEHRDLGREAVSRSLVLLKNQAELLPINGDVDEIFVGGEAADDIGIQSGGWTIEWQGREGAITEGTTILEGLVAHAPEGVTVYHDRFGRLDRIDAGGAALDPDVCLAVVGERPYAEGRGDSYEPSLGNKDLAVLANMRATCDRLAVILISGRPLLITDLLDDWQALVAAWLPGTEGDGVAAAVFGEVPFSGQLSITWPRSVDQLPLGAQPDAPPLFPAGFGLTSPAE